MHITPISPTSGNIRQATPFGAEAKIERVKPFKVLGSKVKKGSVKALKETKDISKEALYLHKAIPWTIQKLSNAKKKFILFLQKASPVAQKITHRSSVTASMVGGGCLGEYLVPFAIEPTGTLAASLTAIIGAGVLVGRFAHVILKKYIV